MSDRHGGRQPRSQWALRAAGSVAPAAARVQRARSPGPWVRPSTGSRAPVLQRQQSKLPPKPLKRGYQQEPKSAQWPGQGRLPQRRPRRCELLECPAGQLGPKCCPTFRHLRWMQVAKTRTDARRMPTELRKRDQSERPRHPWWSAAQVRPWRSPTGRRTDPRTEWTCPSAEPAVASPVRRGQRGRGEIAGRWPHPLPRGLGCRFPARSGRASFHRLARPGGRCRRQVKERRPDQMVRLQGFPAGCQRQRARQVHWARPRGWRRPGNLFPDLPEHGLPARGSPAHRQALPPRGQVNRHPVRHPEQRGHPPGTGRPLPRAGFSSRVPGGRCRVGSGHAVLWRGHRRRRHRRRARWRRWSGWSRKTGPATEQLPVPLPGS